ncbi:MAG TPA: glycosyltransferase family 1 protein [Anaerolineae bacterium]|nr:glycosyltransferase family 1 protein [Anaerolineae bacterium]
MTRLRVVLDGRTINDHFPGIGRYAHRLAIALASAGEVDLTLLHNPSLPNTHLPFDALPADGVTLYPTEIAPFSVAEQTRLPALALRLRPDVWHAPYYVMPYRRLSCPAIVTIYDVIPLALPQFWPAHQRLAFSLAHRLALRAARHVIAISESTRRDLMRRFRVDPGRITVTPLAADERFRPQPESEIRRVRQAYRLPERFILYVGVNKPPKNLPRLLEAYARIVAESPRLDLACVVAGAWDDRYPESRGRTVHLGLGDRVRFLGSIPDADLPALYAAADLFVMPSLYEGFNLPVLEAMACGTPVVCSDTSSLPEVTGDAGLFFNPYDVDQMASTVLQAMTDPELQAELRMRGLERARLFTWERVARQTIDVYRAAAQVT